jgi:hypothetical protein
MVAVLNELTRHRYFDLTTVVTSLRSDVFKLMGKEAEKDRSRLTVPMRQIGRETGDQVGDKAVSLARIDCDLQVRVPDFFVITIAAYREFLESGGLASQLRTILAPARLDAPEDFRRRCELAQALVRDARVPAPVAEAIRDQVAMVKQALPPGSSPVFHFTMYNEMLDAYRSGKLHNPEDVLIIWDDNGDGIMRGLPENRGVWKHGVYYHLAFFGATAKQSVHTVTPMRVAAEFRKIVDAGATEYVLVNVSELREHVMEARMIAEIAWDAKTALAGEDPAARYVDWWNREYFGEAAAPLAADAYRRYYQINDEQNMIWYASVKVRDALGSLMKKVNGESFDPVLPETRETAIAARL